jgi:hypothetical protein
MCTSLFTADEADSSDVRPESPDILEYVEPEAGLDFGSPSPLGMPQTSQMTLINPPSQNYSGFVDEPPIPSPSMAMPSPLPANVTTEMEHEARVHPVVSSFPTSHSRIRSPQQPKEANIAPSQIGKRIEASPVAPSVPAPRPLAAKKKPRRPKPPVPDVALFEAPYRNTRFRSRSVEPSAPLPLPAAFKKSNKRKEKKISQLEPLQESEHEEDRVVPVVPEAPAHISGTLDEELDVEKLLFAATDTGGTAPVSAKLKPRFTEDPKPRRTSLDADDEQTRRDLRQAQGQPPPQSSTLDYARITPKDMLRSFNATLPSASQSRQSSIRPLQTSLLAHSKLSASAASSSSRRVIESSSQPKTPVRPLQTRKNSSSSTESFPVAGTRASDAKKKYEQVEKRSPYKPPAGTRAAQHALSR